MFSIDKNKLSILASFLIICLESCFDNALLPAKFKITTIVYLVYIYQSKAFKYNLPLAPRPQK